MSVRVTTVCECGAETDGDAAGDACGFCGSTKARVEYSDADGQVCQEDRSHWHDLDKEWYGTDGEDL